MNEVEAAGNTPLHNAAYEGWLEGVELLLSLGAKVNASNNAGDRPWHWADNMGHDDVKALLTQASPASDLVVPLLPLVLSVALLQPPVPGIDQGDLPQKGAKLEHGQVLVQDHVPKVKVSTALHSLDTAGTCLCT